MSKYKVPLHDRKKRKVEFLLNLNVFQKQYSHDMIGWEDKFPLKYRVDFREEVKFLHPSGDKKFTIYRFYLVFYVELPSPNDELLFKLVWKNENTY